MEPNALQAGLTFQETLAADPDFQALPLLDKRAYVDYYLNETTVDRKLDLFKNLKGSDKLTAEMLFNFTNVDGLLQTWKKGAGDEQGS
jgi:hypothetical protein